MHLGLRCQLSHMLLIAISTPSPVQGWPQTNAHMGVPRPDKFLILYILLGQRNITQHVYHSPCHILGYTLVAGSLGRLYEFNLSSAGLSLAPRAP